MVPSAVKAAACRQAAGVEERPGFLGGDCEAGYPGGRIAVELRGRLAACVGRWERTVGRKPWEVQVSSERLG